MMFRLFRSDLFRSLTAGFALGVTALIVAQLADTRPEFASAIEREIDNAL